MPRRYRGMDSFWWLAATGRLAARSMRCVMSVRLVGRTRCSWWATPDPCLRGRDLDLGSCRRAAYAFWAGFEEVVGTVASFSSDLDKTVADADLRMHRFLDAVDRYVDDAGLTREVCPQCGPVRSSCRTPSRDLISRLRTSELCSSRPAIARTIRGWRPGPGFGWLDPSATWRLGAGLVCRWAGLPASPRPVLSTALVTTPDMWSIICWAVRHRPVPPGRIDGWLHDPA